jgi:thiaminase (transcriptional activator TenA)
MNYTSNLIDEVQKYLPLQFEKRFLQGIKNGNLEKNRFNNWLKADYPYLVNMLKVVSIGKVKAEDSHDMEAMIRHTRGIEEEMLDHQKHAKKHDLGIEMLNNPNSMGPLKYSYTRHQLATAFVGNIAELQASLLSCMWSYQHLFRMIKKDYNKTNNPYEDLIMYHCEERHMDSFEMACDLIDRKIDKYGTHLLESVKNIFFISVYYETALWDEYYDMSSWDDVMFLKK